MKIVPYTTDHLEFVNGSWYLNPERLTKFGKSYREHVVIPCGQCIECRFQYSRDWADRCILELQSHKSAYFLTLTYDDEHLPPNGSLVKRDLQLFHKRLRKALGDKKIRFFACGEYGDHTFRPHYHDIVFGLEIPDLRLYRFNPETRVSYFNSPWLESIWQHGFVVVGEVNWETCAYTARYVTKKAKGLGKGVYDELGIAPEFCLMSRMPGIGFEYMQSHPGLFQYNSISVATEKGGKQISPPKYFMRKLEQSDPDLFADIKARNMTAGNLVQAAKLMHTELDELSYLAVEARNKEAQLRVFERSQI